VAGAIAVADAGGLSALTIRSLAEALGVKPMSIYHHVANKDAILAAMIDAVFDEIALPPQDADWRTAVKERSLSVRDVVGRHPWAIALMDSRPNPGPATLRHHDAVIAAFRRGGFAIEDVGHAYSLVDSYTYGFAVQEAAMPLDAEDGGETAEGFLDALDVPAYPNLALLAEAAARHGYDPDQEFEFGLELVLDSLARLRRRARRSSP
jgi:AcrR family transcriptional regulator